MKELLLIRRKGGAEMARFQCKCGETLSNSLAPNDIQLHVYTDKEWDRIINMGQIDSVDIPDAKCDVWRCPSCERIYVFDGDRVSKRYVLEKD